MIADIVLLCLICAVIAGIVEVVHYLMGRK